MDLSGGHAVPFWWSGCLRLMSDLLKIFQMDILIYLAAQSETAWSATRQTAPESHFALR